METSGTLSPRVAKFTDSPTRNLRAAAVSLERDLFLRTLLHHLAGTLQDVVGIEEASGFISVVGLALGEEIDRTYKTALGLERLTRQQVTDVLLDLKARIQGDFFVLEEDDEKIVLGNRRCPFADKVIGRPALCMMTSNVFGSIAARNLGYAKVIVQESIAQGHDNCRIAVYLKPSSHSDALSGREYFSDD
jgi:hypothetical protein